MGPNSEQFIRNLTSANRVLLLGGLAVIAHGNSRNTKDVDIWLEPMSPVETWLEAIQQACSGITGVTMHTLPGWQQLEGSELCESLISTGMVRLMGMECPVDVFLRPNNLETSDFERIWKTASPMDDGTRLPSSIELLATKEDTGRDRDAGDWAYLVAKSRREQGASLANADSPEKAREILNAYFDYEVCKRGLLNPDKEIRNLILAELKELADDGDPFAKELLDGNSQH